MGLVALRHVGSSGTRDRTRVLGIGRQLLTHCTTREACHVFLESSNMRISQTYFVFGDLDSFEE